jgi:predicted SnoaL-like aldol condensation-catalyzing enzyme
MKKFLFVISTVLVCFLVSCSTKKEETSSSGMSDKAKKNLEASHIVTDAFKTGDISKIDSAIAPDFVDHTDRGDKNRDSLKAMITWMHSQPGDMKMELVREFANDDYVYCHMHMTGTSDGSMGPKGPYDFNEIEVIRFNSDGKAVEHWAYEEVNEMMKMMGAMQPPTDKKMDNKMDNKMDTTKKSDSKM